MLLLPVDDSTVPPGLDTVLHASTQPPQCQPKRARARGIKEEISREIGVIDQLQHFLTEQRCLGKDVIGITELHDHGVRPKSMTGQVE